MAQLRFLTSTDGHANQATSHAGIVLKPRGQARSTGWVMALAGLVVAAAIALSLTTARADAHTCCGGAAFPMNVAEVFGSYANGSGGRTNVDCFFELGVDNNPNGSYGRDIMFGPGSTCTGNGVTLQQSAHVPLRDALTNGVLATAPDYTNIQMPDGAATWSTGYYHRTSDSQLETINDASFTFTDPSGRVQWEHGVSGDQLVCSGWATASLTCRLTTLPFAFAPDPGQPSNNLAYANQLLQPYVGTVQQIVGNELGYAQSEAGCLEGQVFNPNPSNGDTACRATGSAVKSAKDGAATAQQIVGGELGYAQSETACLQSHVGSPNPSNGDTACRIAGTAVKAANDGIAAAQQIVGGALGAAQSEAGCVQGQVSNPDPSNGDTACRTVGSGVNAAKAGLAGAQTEAGCVTGQLSKPDPSSGDPVCQAVGTVVKASSLPVGPNQSDSCTSAAAKTVFDGFAGSTYAKLIIDQPTGANTALCYRINQGSSAPGGRVEINTGASASAPTVDGNYNACSTTTGNTIQAQHPLFKNTLLGSTQMLDAYTNNGGDVWLCLQADPVGSRILAKAPSGVTPSTITQDSPAVPAPQPTAGPTGYPSSGCQNGTGNVRGLNANIGGAQVWLYGWQESAMKLHLCVRAQNPTQSLTQSAGGQLTFDASGFPGVQPIGPSVSSNTSSCTVDIDHLQAPGVDIDIKSSPPGSNPASLCLLSPTLSQNVAVTAGFSGTAGGPIARWDADPGSPPVP